MDKPFARLVVISLWVCAALLGYVAFLVGDIRREAMFTSDQIAIVRDEVRKIRNGVDYLPLQILESSFR